MKISPFISLFLLISSCVGTTARGNNDDNLSKEENGPSFLIHFWDSIEIGDTSALSRDKIESNFADYAVILANVPDSAARQESVNRFLKKAEKDTLTYRMIADIAARYLYNPNSPMFDEESYIPFLRTLKDSPLIDEAQRMRYDFLLDGALKNRPGMKAADFSFTTREGDNLNLHDIKSRNEIMLIFYDPDCDHCQEVIEFLADDEELTDLTKKGEVTVLAIYSGEDRELWQQSAFLLPEEWIVGYDSGSIEDEELYLLPAMPTIYILDADKKVLIKELPLSRLIHE